MTSTASTPPMAREKMSVSFSLFNYHVNNANRRARRVMRDMGKEKWVRQINRLSSKGGGIMYILQVPVSPAIACYLGLIVAFVNEDRT